MCFTFILGWARRILGWAGPTWPPLCYALVFFLCVSTVMKMKIENVVSVSLVIHFTLFGFKELLFLLKILVGLKKQNDEKNITMSKSGFYFS
jgi:hypothetical protein